MKNVSSQFAKDMLQAELSIDIVTAIFRLAKYETKTFRSKHPIALEAISIHEKVRQLGTTLEAYDGAFLSICAQYEFATRTLIERFISQLDTEIPLYSNLPETIRDWYPEGCANIILNVNQDKFQNITHSSILVSLASCINCSLKRPYHLIPEAFSYHDKNLSADIIQQIFQKRLGIKSVWQKLGRQKALSDHLHTPNNPTTEQVARQRLNGAIQQRNNIIHRGKAFYHPGESEIQETARFFRVLIGSLAEVMVKNLAAM